MTDQAPQAMRCIDCGYDLRNLRSTTCPECGREFDPNDWYTFKTERHSINGRICLGAAVVSMILPPLGAALSFSEGAAPWLIMLSILGITVAGSVLWDAMPGVMRRTELIDHPVAMYAGFVLAILSSLGAVSLVGIGYFGYWLMWF